MDVKPWIKVMVGIMLSFMILFTGIGYAALNDTLKVTGTAEVQIPSGLFITSVETDQTSNVDYNTVSHLEYTTTVNSIVSRRSSTGSVVYKITVLNNTNYEYAYRGLYYTTTYGNNSYVSTTNNSRKLGVVVSFPNGSIVGPKDTLVFYATYTIGRNVGSSLNLDTLLNFQFGINVNSIDAAADIVHAKFLDILNTSTTYQQLYETLDDKFDGNQEWTSNYIGNVGNAVDNDMMTVETLFAGQLTMIVNGQPQKAWVIIKHENLDGNENTGDDYTLNYNQYGEVTHRGCEMTLYLTTDSLSQANGWAPVYATVFTCDRDAEGNIDGKWYKVGDSYYGQANIVGYRGEAGGTGSFVTDNWKSYSSAYTITDDYSYNVGANVSIKTLMQTHDTSTIRAFQTQLEKAEEMIANPKYAGTGITDVEEAYAKAAKFYTLNDQGKAIANTDTLRVWLIPIMRELDHVLSVAQDAIDQIEQGTQ